MTLAELIKRMRGQRGLSIQEVAEAAGLKRNHVHRMEKGERCNPQLMTMLGLAQALHVKPEVVLQAAINTLAESPREP